MISDKLRRPSGDAPRSGDHPVLAGLVAFVAVVAVVAAVVGGAAWVGSRSLGLSDDGAIDTGATARETLFLPRPSDTEEPGGPFITLPSDPQADQPTSEPPQTSEAPVDPIVLAAGQSAVGPMERIDLTGSYPGGEGAVLRVQQFEGGAWTDFPVTASVSGGAFTTYIQTGAVGPNRFRMIDTDTGEASNVVRVQIG